MSKLKLSCHDLSDQVRFVMKIRQDDNLTDCTSAFYAENDTKLSWSIEHGVFYAKNDIELSWLVRQGAIYDETRQDNDVTNRTSAIYVENETGLSWPIRLSAICDKNQIGQRLDWLYKSDLCWKWYEIVVTNQFGYRLWWKPNRTMTWLIIQMQSTLKMKLSCHDWSDWVWSVTKTRQDNDMTNHVGLLYTKIKIELLGPIWSGVVYDENHKGQWRNW